MDTIILTGIGATAAAYIAYVIWRGANGKTACACDSGGSCRKAKTGCHCKL